MVGAFLIPVLVHVKVNRQGSGCAPADTPCAGEHMPGCSRNLSLHLRSSNGLNLFLTFQTDCNNM